MHSHACSTQSAPCAWVHVETPEGRKSLHCGARDSLSENMAEARQLVDDIKEAGLWLVDGQAYETFPTRVHAKAYTHLPPHLLGPYEITEG